MGTALDAWFIPVACINNEDNCDLVSFTSICSHLSAPPTTIGLTFDPDSFTLTCTSTGFPRPTATWTKDGSLLTDGYSASQVVGSGSSTIYDSILTLPRTGNTAGNYSCVTESIVGKSAAMSIELDGNGSS